MKTHPAHLRNARGSLIAILLVATAVGGWLFAPESRSQGVIPMTANASLTPMLAKLKTQQDEIAANQTKIEAQTALLKESIRQAKIYAARGGSGHR